MAVKLLQGCRKLAGLVCALVFALALLIACLVGTIILWIDRAVLRQPERVDTRPSGFGWRVVGETTHFFLSDGDGRFTPVCGLDADGESVPVAPFGVWDCQACYVYFRGVWMVQAG